MNTAGERIIKSARQALAFAEGKYTESKVHVPAEIDVARIREKVKMSQTEFAEHFGVSVRTVQDWEKAAGCRAVRHGRSSRS
jgi:putative transcriptional regulator